MFIITNTVHAIYMHQIENIHVTVIPYNGTYIVHEYLKLQYEL